MTKSPIQTRTRTITETVIVPGDYGRIQLRSWERPGACLRLTDRGGNRVDFAIMTVDELKATGQLLLDLADALAKGARIVDPGDEPSPVMMRMGPTASALAADALNGTDVFTSVVDDWIEWHGGDCPVSPSTRVDYRIRNGDEGSDAAGNLVWAYGDESYDIAAYRIAD